jgi:hypothetical protein
LDEGYENLLDREGKGFGIKAVRDAGERATAQMSE